MRSMEGGWLFRTGRRCTDACRSFFGLGAAHSGPTSSGVPAIPVETAAHRSPMASWKTTEVCREWRATSTTLRGTLSAGELEQVSRLRRCCLDELQRRDPQAFDRWLADRQVADDPTPFFRHPARP